MPSTFDQTYIQEYDNTLSLQFQQFDSRLLKTLVQDKAAAVNKYYNRMNALPNPAVRSTRFSPNQPTDLTFSRRVVTPTSFEMAVLLDSFDLMRTNIDPSSDVVKEQMAAFHRQIDDTIVASITGVAYTQTTVNSSLGSVSPLAANTVAINYNEPGTGQSGNTGLTVGKLKLAKKILFGIEAAMPNERIYAVVNQVAINQLLRDPQVTNFFYQDSKPLVNGELDAKFLGFDFIRSERIPNSASSGTTSSTCPVCLVYTESALKYCWLDPLHGRIDPRPDLQGEVWQLKALASFNAVRMWEEKVVQILIDPTQ